MFKSLSAALVAMPLIALAQPASAQGLLLGRFDVRVIAISGDILMVRTRDSNEPLTKPATVAEIYANTSTSVQVPKTAKIRVNGVVVQLGAVKPEMKCYMVARGVVRGNVGSVLNLDCS